MPPVLKAHIDFETRSAVDLRKAGMHRYAEDPTTEIVCMSWRLGDGPVQRWRPGEPTPSEIFWPGVVAHNAGFERCIWNAKTPYGWPELEIAEQDCTMARAAAMGALRQVAGETAAVVVTRLTGVQASQPSVDAAVGAALAARGLA